MRTSSSARGPKSHRQGDAAKTVLIVIAVVGGVMMLSCLGIGVAGYFWFQRNFGNVAVSDPVKIRAMTAELADISIPAEFQPVGASQIFEMNIVHYQWCPAGNCPTWADADEDSELLTGESGTLTLSTFVMDGDGEAESEESVESEFAEEYLKTEFRNYTRDVQEFTIGGKACKFFIVKGEEIPIEEQDGDEPAVAATDESTEMPAEAAANTTPAGTEPTTDQPAADPTTPVAEPVTAEPVDPAKPGRSIVRVKGVFPGKKGNCSLELELPVADYDEAKILQMLQSIK